MIGRVSAISALIAFLAGMTFATFSESRVFLPALLEGAVVTVQVSILSIIAFYLVSFVAGISKISSIALIRWIATIYIEFFRGTSLLVILFWLFYVMPEFGLTMTPMTAGVLGIGLNFGAYGAEIVRGGFTAVPKGQWEACTALNMPPWKRMIRIILPQAIIVMIPGFGNITIEMVKATALVSAVTLVDITYASVQQNQIYYRTIEIFMVTLLLYYCLAQLIRFGASMLEERAMRHLQRGL